MKTHIDEMVQKKLLTLPRLDYTDGTFVHHQAIWHLVKRLMILWYTNGIVKTRSPSCPELLEKSLRGKIVLMVLLCSSWFIFFFFFSKSINPYTYFDEYHSPYALFWTPITTKQESFTTYFFLLKVWFWKFRIDFLFIKKNGF